MARMSTILLPTDGSPTAAAASHYAEDIARAQSSHVIVLGIAQRAFVGPVENEALTEAIVETVGESVDAEVARLGQAGIDAEPLVIRATSAHEGILKVAGKRHADLIVMGTHGRSALGRATLGSVADRVVRHAEMPVLLVPLVEG